MILLDTNVISEVMRPSPSAEVLGWLASRPISEFATTTLNIAEISYGLARLEFGRRRTELELRFNSFVSRGFAERGFRFRPSSGGGLWRSRHRARAARPTIGGLRWAHRGDRPFSRPVDRDGQHRRFRRLPD